ncbi:MAG: MerR family transcriptional regulator [Pseudobdellovibrionaceae bacterium]
MSEIATKTESAKSESAFRTISEVADDLNVPQHVLRFWETKFTQVKPLKRGGGRRYYRPEDVALLKKIHNLLYVEGYTIKGVQKLLKGVSKSQVLAEQKQLAVADVAVAAPALSATRAFGASLPQMKVPDQEQREVAHALADHGSALEEVLSELLEMREQLRSLMQDDQESTKAA